VGHAIDGFLKAAGVISIHSAADRMVQVIPQVAAAGTGIRGSIPA
jgi:hypothetical protein